MPKFDEREGNSCHIHLSLRGEDGTPVFAEGHGFSATFQHLLAGPVASLPARWPPPAPTPTPPPGPLAGRPALMPLFAPNINSYKRYAKGSFAPTAVAWGRDNRTCSLRVVGHGPSLRVENRIPGGDVNPYLAISAMIAAGLHGIENGLPLEDEFAGNAYETDKPHVPTTLKEARELFAASSVSREAFGDEVVEHYLNAARVEIEAYESAGPAWERHRTLHRPVGAGPRRARPPRRRA